MQTASLVNSLYAQTRNPAPEVGMGATICCWTDRHACTVVEVSRNGRVVTVQRDKATRTDSYGMSDCQSYTYEADPSAPAQVFTLRRNGRFVAEGCGMKDGNVLSLGHRNEYHDYSF